MLVTGPHGDAQVLSSHSDEHQLIAHARSRISEDIGHTPVPFEASITVFNADAGFGESRVRRFLCWCQLISGFPLLFSLAFDGRHDHSIPDLQPLKATVRANGQGLLAGQVRLVQNLLIMFAAGSFFAGGQDVLGLWVRDGEVLLGMALLLAGVVFLLLRWLCGPTNGPPRSVGEDSQFLEFGERFDDLFEGASLRSLGSNVG